METTTQPTIEFDQLVRRGCGLDVHKELLVATIRGEGLPIQTRSFGAFTQDIEELAAWLRTHEVTHVAMESTGVYWKPVRFGGPIQCVGRRVRGLAGQCPPYQACARPQDR